jgi:hypothetical protein
MPVHDVVDTHVPVTQLVPVGQIVLQEPQFRLLFRMLVSQPLQALASQSAKLALQWHCEAEQNSFGPQFAADAQVAPGPAQPVEETQVPETQLEPAGHKLPHNPQLLGSP